MNRLIAYSRWKGVRAALELLKEVEGKLPESHIRWVFTCDLHKSAGNNEMAHQAYKKALGLTANKVEKQFISKKLTATKQAFG